MQRLTPTLLAILTLASCHSPKMKPRAAGTMYDVVVAADSKEAEAIVSGILSTPVEMLPQSEPWFNAMAAGSTTLTNATKYARNIVVVAVDSTKCQKTRVKYEHDVYAKGQTIVYISTPSPIALRGDSARLAGGLLALLDKAELESEARRMASHANKQAARLTIKAASCTMAVPEDINSTKVGRNFVWLSNNANKAMLNICVYAYPGTTLNAKRAIDARDSVMKANIEGEATGSYVQTERRVDPRVSISHDRLTMRGLWIMKGDAMGGPFISTSMVDSARGRIVVAEGFVYAPESKKKILTKQLEAAISTLKLHTK